MATTGDAHSFCPKCCHRVAMHHDEDGRGPKWFKCWERMSHENNDFCGCTHGIPEPTQLLIYAVRNHEKKWFRAKGRGGYGESWVDDIASAKMYPKVSQARARVTYFANNSRSLPAPDLVEFTVVQTRVIDEKERLKEAQQKKQTSKQRKAEWLKEHLIANTQAEIKNAKARLAQLLGQSDGRQHDSDCGCKSCVGM